MISPVGGSSTVQQTTNKPAAAPAPAKAPQQDTVHLSQAAKAASGDADHDGDSQ